MPTVDRMFLAVNFSIISFTAFTRITRQSRPLPGFLPTPQKSLLQSK
jgi:uncharacterized membrane protein